MCLSRGLRWLCATRRSARQTLSLSSSPMLACSAGLRDLSFPREREITAKQANEEGSGWIANGRACEFANAIRAIQNLRFPRQRAAGRSHCAGAREPERKERAAGAGSLAVLDRRRSRVAALRLPRAARTVTKKNCSSTFGNSAISSAGRPRHRPDEQAARVRTARQWHGHGGSERNAGFCRRRARLRFFRANPEKTGRDSNPAAFEQSGKSAPA